MPETVPPAGVHVGEDGIDQHLVIPFPGGEALVGLFHLGFYKGVSAGCTVFPEHARFVQLPLLDGGSGIAEYHRLALVEVEPFDLYGMLALLKHLGRLFFYRAAGSVAFDQHLSVHVESAAVVGR